MYEYDFHTYSVRRKRSNKKIIFNFLGVCIVLIFVIWFTFGGKADKPKTEQKVLSAVEEEINADSKLGVVVRQALADTKGQYSVVVKHLKTGESYSLNAHRVYDAGSLYKLWVMAEVFKQINEKKLAEDDEIKIDVEGLNKKFRIASEEADLTEGEIDLTVGSALRQMITISHNYAALSLAEKTRLSNIK